MSWNNQNGQNGQNGQPPRQRKMPMPGAGRLRKTQKKQPTSPDFAGLAALTLPLNMPPPRPGDTIFMEISSWHEPAKPSQDGSMMPESYGLRLGACDNQGQRYEPLQSRGGQQQMQMPQQQVQYPPQQYAPPPQYAPVYAQPAPGPAYAPGPTPPQHGGYAPAPGYQPPPQQAPPQQPAWGGQPGRPQQQAQAAPPKMAEPPF